MDQFDKFVKGLIGIVGDHLAWKMRKRHAQEQAEVDSLAELREASANGENVCLKCETRGPPRCDEGHCLNCARTCGSGHCQKCRSCNLCPYCGCGGGGSCGCDD